MQARTALFLIAALVTAVPAVAQTPFEWPDTAVDVAKYTTLEECRAAVHRVNDLATAREYQETRIWMDTIRFDESEYRKPVYHEVGTTAQRCMDRFSDPATAPLDDFRFLIPMYLLAGWPNRAHALAERQLATVSDTSRQFAATLDTLLELYAGRGDWDTRSAPSRRTLLRHDLVDSIVVKHIPRVPKRLTRIRLYRKAISAYGREGEARESRADSLIERVVSMVDSLTESERRELHEASWLFGEGEEQADRMAGLYAFGVLDFYDSLRVSTEKYVRAKRNAWTRATGQPPETYLLGAPIGEKAPPIEADFWLGCKGECGVRPVPGRINLLVRLSRQECSGVPEAPSHFGAPMDKCTGTLIPLRRLMQRYPDVVVTIVARTSGHYLYLKDGITPEDEAKHMRQWLDWYGIDAPIAVNETEFWRISEHDRRRVNRPDPNDENYSFGGTAIRQGGVATMLIDPDGLIVRVRNVNRHSENEYGELIDALHDQAKSKP